MTIVHRLVLLATLLLCCAPALAAQPAPGSGSTYRMDVHFDPNDGALSASGTLEIHTDEALDGFELLLNGGLAIDTLQPDRNAAVTFENGISIDSYALPQTQRITVTLVQPLLAGERMSIAFDYAGQVTTDSIEIGRGVVTPGWSEMTMEALWYPVWLKGTRVHSDVTLTLPAGYQVAAPGRVEPAGEGRWRLRPNGPVSGRVTFIASDGWVETRRALGEGLSGVVLSIDPEPRADAILDGTAAAFAAYRALFGEPETASTALTIVYANRDIGLKYPRQAYSTGGDFIVLDQSDERVQLDTLHHEVAHFWWSRGRPGTPHEFLSESISEYLAVRHGGDAWGDAWLETRRATMAQRSAAIEGSLRDIDGLTATRQDLLYHRGPTALFALQDRIGRGAVDALLVQAHAAPDDTLDAFLQLLAAQQGQDVADRFASEL
ncbi:hypothetical protein E2F46_09730 [Luteimonas aestuarii]|uniref:Peptidase M1 membrane alanine aminopeptidase domain-containing protein n=1 Tax=Luteimonas aestuarii TaxID=453837 RepID=A0A4R5TN66_9GAMM|nr:hypothetical protein [Luteimonas aestuarii]TDK23801.1 hypothetical protein E2F46_09730 [Luteimonas aestuarii]